MIKKNASEESCCLCYLECHRDERCIEKVLKEHVPKF